MLSYPVGEGKYSFGSSKKGISRLKLLCREVQIRVFCEMEVQMEVQILPNVIDTFQNKVHVINTHNYCYLLNYLNVKFIYI